MTPTDLGNRDGRDAFLLDKKIKNPFKWKSDECNEYYVAFRDAYEEEFNKFYIPKELDYDNNM